MAPRIHLCCSTQELASQASQAMRSLKEASAKAAELATAQEAARKLLKEELEAERAESAASREAARKAVQMLATKEVEWKEELSTALTEVAEKVEQEAVIREALFKYKMETLDAVISLEKEAAVETERKMRDNQEMAVALTEVASKVEAEATSAQKLLLVEKANAGLSVYGPGLECAVEFVVSAPAGAQGVLLIGNANALGGWDKARGVPMSRSGEGGEWRCTVQLAAARVYAYKYVITDAQGNAVDEPQQENVLSIRGTEDTLQVLDEWAAPQRGKVVSATGTELRQERLAALLADIVAEAIPPSSSSVSLSR